MAQVEMEQQMMREIYPGKAHNPYPSVYAPDPTVVARMDEIEDRIAALSVGKEPMSREALISAAKLNMLQQIAASNAGRDDE